MPSHAIAPFQRQSQVGTEVQITADLGPQASPQAREASMAIPPGTSLLPPAPGMIKEPDNLDLHRIFLTRTENERRRAQFRGNQIAVIGEKFSFFIAADRRMASKAHLFGRQEGPACGLQLATGPQGP